MATLKKRVSFFESEEGLIVEATLRKMTLDTTFNTDSTYSANSVRYPDNRIPFVDKHMNYLNLHPNIDPHQYLANLRLMTRFK